MSRTRTPRTPPALTTPSIDRLNVNATRAWLDAHAVQISNEIALLQQRLAMINTLRSQLLATPAKTQPITQPITKPITKRKITKSHATVQLALEAAGDNGLTSRELSEVAQIPIGTASSTLTVLKSRGEVRYIHPRYFALHSAQEDNNTDNNAKRTMQ